MRRRSGVSNLIITFDERVSTISSEVKKFADHVNEVLVGQYVPTVHPWPQLKATAPNSSATALNTLGHGSKQSLYVNNFSRSMYAYTDFHGLL